MIITKSRLICKPAKKFSIISAKYTTLASGCLACDDLRSTTSWIELAQSASDHDYIMDHIGGCVCNRRLQLGNYRCVCNRRLQLGNYRDVPKLVYPCSVQLRIPAVCC